MRRKVRMIALGMAAVMAAGVCGGCGGSSKPQETTGVQNTAAQTNAGTDADTAAPEQDTAAPETAMPEVELPPQGDVAAMAASEKPITINFMSFNNNPFWDQINEGRDAAKEYLKNFNCTVEFTDMGSDTTAEIVNNSLDVAIIKEPAGIVVCPMADGTEAYVDKAGKAGISVVTYLSESTNQGDSRIAFSGSDAISGGQEAAKAIADFTGGSGKIGVITGYLTMNQHEERRKGMLDKLTELAPDITVVATVEAHDSTEETYSAAKDMLTANPDLKVIYCTAGGPYGAAQAVKEMGLTGKVGVVCFDWVPDNVKYVASGEIIAAVSQDPQAMAFNAIVMCYNNIVTGWKPDTIIQVTQSDILTPENIAEKLPDYKK